MNLKQLETFMQIVEKGSFSAAADVLHTTQSTVSARVKDLEHYFGATLFDRSSHRAMLTEDGRELFEMSRHLIETMDSLRDRIGRGSALGGTARIGVVGLVASDFLPRFVARMRKCHPSIVLELELGLSGKLLDKVASGHLDLAVVTGTAEEDDLRSETLTSEDFAWMASPCLGVPKRVLGPVEVGTYPLLTFSQDSYHVPIIKGWFRSAGVAYKPLVACNNMDVIARLVRDGHGIGLLPKSHYTPELESGSLETIETSPRMPSVDILLVHPRTRSGPVSRAAVQCVRDVFEESGSEPQGPGN